MPVTYEIDQQADLLRLVLSGTVTTREFEDYFRSSVADPAFRPEMDRLVVALDVKGFPRASEVRSVSIEVGKRAGRGSTVRVAVVVNTPFGRGMANMFLIQAGVDRRFEMFSDEQSARSWLANK
jgi:hypothetical protein